MANAIHKTVSGDTLQSLAGLYFAINLPSGAIDDAREKKVIRGIRDATPTTVTDLSGFTDTADLGADKTVYVPTIRSLNRSLYVDNASLDTAMKGKGFDHARKVLRRPLSKVIPYLTGFTSTEIIRGYVLTQYINLDGMDTYAAKYLYDTAAITSLSSLASQSKATMDSILTTLTQSPHNRPTQLTQQRHSERWPREASLYTRKRISELAVARDMRHGLPVKPSVLREAGDSYKKLADGDTLTPSDRQAARYLERLNRFAESVMRGNLALHAGQWKRAERAHQLARRHFHWLALATGAVSSAVDDKVGINLNIALDTVKRILETLPAEDPDLLGIQGPTTITGRTNTTYGLRGFRYDELETGGQFNRKSELQGSLTSVAVHKLPRRQRSALQRGALDKTQGTLSSADTKLVSGLITGGTTFLARDMPSIDKAVLQRNIGGSAVSNTYSGGTGLDLFDSACAKLPVAEVSSLVGTLWSGLTANDVLSTSAKAAYPSSFLTSVTPFAKFVALPGVASASLPTFVAVDSNFVANIRDVWMKDRLKSTTGADIRPSDESWLHAGSLAVNAAWSYAWEIPQGLRQSYAAVGNEIGMRTFGNTLVNWYQPDGTLVRDVAGASPTDLIFDLDLQSCTTVWMGSGGIASVSFVDVLDHAEWYGAYADQKYREENPDEARIWYEDVACAIAQADPGVVDEGRIALTGTYEGIQQGNNPTSTFSVTYTDGTGTHRVQENATIVYQGPKTGTSLAEANAVVDQYFGWLSSPSGVVDIASDDLEIDVDHSTSGTGTGTSGGSGVRFGATVVESPLLDTSDNYKWYLYCTTQITAIDLGLNWLGYPEYHVPPWSADHLYAVARDLCNRALEAEALVLRLTEAWEQAQTDEFLALQSADLATAQVHVTQAEAFLANQSAELAVTQADLAAQNQQLTQNQNVIAGIVSGLGAIAGGIGTGAAVGSAGGPFGAIIGGIIGGAAAGLAGAGGSAAEHNKYKAATATAETALVQANNVAIAAQVLGLAKVDLAYLAQAQAVEYLAFLQDQLLDSSAYEKLLALAWDAQEVYQRHATRVSWLTERALAHETRQSFDMIKVDYGSDDELYNMTRAQRLTSDLESLRGTYAAGESARRQQLKWIVPLSALNPAALDQLRQTGECSFALGQQMLDLLFPGLYLHSLQEMQVTVVGLIPAEGVRGVLQLSALSWIRVPNTSDFTTAAAALADDWITSHLASSPTPPTGSDAAFTEYADYRMKQVIASGAELSLSAFDVTRDSAVLRAPQGMLSALQHHGLDTSLRLSLPRTANAFEWKNISDVELTLWFLAAYDDTLAQAQKEAVWRMGERNELERAASTRFPTDQPKEWADFLAGPTETERVDLRTLVFDVPAGAPFETARLVTNLCFALQRATGSTALPLRLACDTDPVGVALSMGTPGAPIPAEQGVAYTDVGVTETLTPPADTALMNWFTVEDRFYDNYADPQTRTPLRDPQQRFVIKIAPSTAGSDWHKRDAHGVVENTLSGPLTGTDNAGTAGTASLTNGSFLNAVAKVNVAHKGGTARVRLRGPVGYGLEIAPTQVRIRKAATAVVTRNISYPADEFLQVELKVWDQADGTAKIEGWIDGLKVIEHTDASSVAAAGTVVLAVPATAAGPVPVQFDDLEIYELTGLGVQGALVLSQPFTTSLPSDWTFVNGSVAWAISTTKHNRLDLANLVGMGLKVDYRFKVVQ